MQVRILLLCESNKKVLFADRLYVMVWGLLIFKIRLKVNLKGKLQIISKQFI